MQRRLFPLSLFAVLICPLAAPRLRFARAAEEPQTTAPAASAPADANAPQTPAGAAQSTTKLAQTPPNAPQSTADAAQAPQSTADAAQTTPNAPQIPAEVPQSTADAAQPAQSAADAAQTPTTPADAIESAADAIESATDAILGSGQENISDKFSFSAPGGVIYDMENGLAVANGPVELSYGDFRVRGNRGVLNNNTNSATLSDDLIVTARDPRGIERTFRGQSLTFDLTTGRWTLSQIRATFPPQFFAPGTVLEPIYLRNGSVTGDYETASGSDFRFSSCDRDHYFLQSKRLDFYRDRTGAPDRIVLKRNGLYLFGQKILPLPVFVISLQGQRTRRVPLQPTVGQNSFDGYFAKTVVDLGASSWRTDSLLVDLLQKRGIGLGLQRELAQGAGAFYLYALSGRNGGREIDTRLSRTLQLARNLTTILNYQSTTNNSITGEGFSNSNGDASFFYNAGRVQSSLLLSQNASGGAGSNFSQQNSTFTYSQDFGAGWDVVVNSLYAGARSTGSDDQATLDNDFALTRRGSRFDAFLNAQLRDDLSGREQINGAYQLERLPELSFNSDTTRLGIPFLDRILPGDINLSVGNFNEPASLNRLNRTEFKYQARPRDVPLLRTALVNSSLRLRGDFEQAFYSNDTARYSYTNDIGFNFGLGRQRNGVSPLAVEVSYLKYRPLGFTPFQFDFQTPTETISASAVFAPSSKLKVELSTGRDLQFGISRDISGRLRFAPSSNLIFDLQTSYSTEGGGLRDVTGNIYLARSRERFGGGKVVLGLRYSPQDSTFSTINVGADLQFGRLTSLQAFTGYNGISKKFDFGQFRVVRDLHCFNLYATYDQQRKQFRFDLALKAFPFLDSRLGQNQFGEGFDPEIGAVR